MFKVFTICPAGDNGLGGECDCSNVAGWIDGEWPIQRCNKGRCYARQENDVCNGKDNGHWIGDGTWCWDNFRDTRCEIIPGVRS